MATLLVNPSSVQMYNVSFPGSGLCMIDLYASGGNVQVTAIAFATGTYWSWAGQTLPFTITSGTSVQIGFIFAPAAADDMQRTDTLSITNNGSVSPVTIVCDGWGRRTGYAFINFDPSSYNLTWLGAIPQGNISPTKVVKIWNTGTQPLVISSIAFLEPFEETNPKLIFPVSVQPSQSVSFGVMFRSPSAATTTRPGLVVYGNSTDFTGQSGAEDYILSGTGSAIAAANIVTGGLVVLVGFTGGSVLRADPTTIDSEIAASAERVLGPSNVDKTLRRIRFKYENLGQATVRVDVTTKNGTANDSLAIGTVGADGTILEAVSKEFNLEGQLVTVKFSRALSSGPVSIVEYTMVYDEGSTQSSLAMQGIPVPANIVNAGAQPLVMLANGTVLRFTPTDLNCEEVSSAKRLHRFLDPQTPPLVENQDMRALFKYEDLGAGTASVTLRTKRGSVTSPAPVAYGTGAADGTVRQAFFDLQITDELVEITISKTAGSGPLSLIEYSQKYEPRGEVIEGA